MKKIAVYLLIWLAAMVLMLMYNNITKSAPAWLTSHLLLFRCTAIGTIGGVLYGLRAIYIHRCVKKNWDSNWQVWYFLRPIVSGITAFVSYLFLKAGLLVLDAQPRTDAFMFGYLAVAFIAGYNVDNFLKKLESVACEMWGIDKSHEWDEVNPSPPGKDQPK